jgi:plastocyanin
MRGRRLLGVGLLAAALGGAGAGALVASAAQTRNVTATGTSFSPGTVTVTVGDTVHWKLGGGGPHTTQADPNQAEQWDSGDLTSAGFEHTFNSPGTFTYFCKYHRDFGMTGKVVVQQAGGPPPEAPPKVSFKARTLRSSKRGVVKLRVRNPNAFPISGKVRLDTARRVTVARKRKLKLGSARFQIDVGQTKTVRLKLSKLARRTLKRHHKLKVNATFVAGTAGQAANKTVKRGVTLKAPKHS